MATWAHLAREGNSFWDSLHFLLDMFFKDLFFYNVLLGIYSLIIKKNAVGLHQFIFIPVPFFFHYRAHQLNNSLKIPTGPLTC